MKYITKRKRFGRLSLKQIVLLAVAYRLEKQLNATVTIASLADEMQRLELLPKDLVGVKEGVRTRVYQLQFQKKLMTSKPYFRNSHTVGGTEKEYTLLPEACDLVKKFVEFGASYGE